MLFCDEKICLKSIYFCAINNIVWQSKNHIFYPIDFKGKLLWEKKGAAIADLKKLVKREVWTLIY